MLQDGDLRLRPCDLARDADVALPWYRDPEVLRMSEGPDALAFDRARVVRMYECLASAGELYLIEVRDEGIWRAVGDVTLADPGCHQPTPRERQCRSSPPLPAVVA